MYIVYYIYTYIYIYIYIYICHKRAKIRRKMPRKVHDDFRGVDFWRSFAPEVTATITES